MPQLNFVYYPIVIFWSTLLFFLFYFVFSYFILFFFCRDYKYENAIEFLKDFLKKIIVFLYVVVKSIFFFLYNLSSLYIKFFFFKFNYLSLKSTVRKYRFLFLKYVKFFNRYCYYKLSLEQNFKNYFVITHSMIFLDLPYKGQYLFQDPATPIMEGIINFHHDLLFIQIFIATFVLWMLIRILIKFRRKAYWQSKKYISPNSRFSFNFLNPSFSTQYKYNLFNQLYDLYSDHFVIGQRFTRSDYPDERGNYPLLTFNVLKREFDLIMKVDSRACCSLDSFNKYRRTRVLFARHKYDEKLKDSIFFKDLNKFFWESSVFYDDGIRYGDPNLPIERKYDLGYHKRIPSQIVHHTLLEIVWTVVPSLILIYIAIPSFALLYAMDELIAPVITVKIIGNQWYWRYELSVIRDNHYFFTDYNNFAYLKDQLNIFNVYETHSFDSKINSFKDLNTNKNDLFSINQFGLLCISYNELFSFYESLSFGKAYTPFNINLLGASILKQKKRLLRLFTNFFISNHDFLLDKFILNNLLINFNSTNCSDCIYYAIVDKFFLSKLYIDTSLAKLVNKYGKITYEARLIGSEDKDYFIIPPKKGLYRLLDTDNALILPEKLSIRLLITASDVLHSWSVPSFGIKLDACPGRLNQTGLFLKRIGTFYGQCSEICGINHAFMPIVVKGVSYENYDLYKLSFLLKGLNKFFHI